MPIHSTLKTGSILILVVHTIILCGCSAKNEPAAKVKPSPLSDPPISHVKNPALGAMLVYYDQLFNPNANMLRFAFNNPGYHSQIPSGTRVHRVRESLAYALGLLQRGEHGDRERAIKILHKVVYQHRTQCWVFHM